MRRMRSAIHIMKMRPAIIPIKPLMRPKPGTYDKSTLRWISKIIKANLQMITPFPHRLETQVETIDKNNFSSMMNLYSQVVLVNDQTFKFSSFASSFATLDEKQKFGSTPRLTQKTKKFTPVASSNQSQILYSF